MAYTSNVDAIARALARGIDVGLIRAGAVIADRVRDKVRGGYTTGDFVTGALLNSIYATDPTTEGGARVVHVTTRLTDPNYPLFWEEGHVNLWAGPKSGGRIASSIASKREGRYLVVPKWAPALEETTAQAEALFAEAVGEAAVAAGAALSTSVSGGLRPGRGG